MRRLIATAAVGAALFSVTACADPSSPDASASPSTGASSAPADNTAACAELETATKQFEADLTPIIGAIVTAAAANDQAAVNEQTTKLIAALGSFKDAYAAPVATIADPELKAAVEADLKTLDDSAAKALAAGGDAMKLNEVMNDPAFQAAGAKVAEICAA